MYNFIPTLFNTCDLNSVFKNQYNTIYKPLYKYAAQQEDPQTYICSKYSVHQTMG